MYKCFNSFQTPSLWLLQSGRALMFFTAIMLTGACKTSTPLQSGSLSDTKFYESVLPRDAEQILLVVKNLTDSLFQGSMLTLERKSGKMVTVFPPIKVSLGKSGIVSAAVKREGDGATPAGFYPLGQLYTYEASVNTQLSFTQVTGEDKWIDDPDSPEYNQHVRGATLAKSYENLLLSSIDYKYCMVIEYNTHPVIKGKGSAIFFHVTNDKYTSTAGCVAVQERDVLQILSWLHPKKKKYVGIIL